MLTLVLFQAGVSGGFVALWWTTTLPPGAFFALPAGRRRSTPVLGTAMNAGGIANEQHSVEGSDGRYADLTALFCTTTACPA